MPSWIGGRVVGLEHRARYSARAGSKPERLGDHIQDLPKEPSDAASVVCRLRPIKTRALFNRVSVTKYSASQR
jgi:hypothetical protein